MGIITKAFIILLLFCRVAVPLQADSSIHNEHFVLQTDTITEEAATNAIVSSESFYGTPHNLPLHNTKQPIPIESSDNSDWMLYFLLAGLVFLSIAWFNFPVQCKKSFYAVLGLRYFFQINKEGGFFKGTHNYLLFFNFLIALSLMIYQSLIFAGIYDILEYSGQEYVFIAILLIILLLYILKYLVVNFLSWVFSTPIAGSIYLGNIIVFNQFIGLALMPLLFHNAFNPSLEAMYLMWSLVVGANVYKVIRGSVIAHNVSGFPVYYLFLYLCGIELLPLLLAWKVLKIYITAF